MDEFCGPRRPDRVRACCWCALFFALAPLAGAQTPIIGVLPDTTLYLSVPGSYYLDSDVEWFSTSPLATAPIAIAANGVSLNLNGKTIRAVGSATNAQNLTGIVIASGTNVTVTNGTIRGFRENGVSVSGGTYVTLADLTIADIHNPTTNDFTNGNSVAGLSVELSSATVSNVVISNVSGGTNVMMVAGLEAFAAPGLKVFGTTVTAVSNAPAVGASDNLCNGISVLFSPNAVFSNVTVANVVGNSNTASVNGLVTFQSPDFQLVGSTSAGNAISGVTNYGAVAAGISGTDVSGMTVRDTRVSGVFTGTNWTNNLIGHTALGMVFAPLNGYPLGFSGVTVTNGGRGYTSAPTVTISPVPNDSGSGATARATVRNGRVVAVEVLVTGSNFMTFPSITFSGGGGAGAAAIVLPSQVVYDASNTNTGGNVIVTDCLVEDITGSIDDAHGISFFGVTNVVASNVVVRNVRDGFNDLGLGGSKATGIENFGNPMVNDSKIKLIDCRAENIQANSPGDLAANGFSAAGGGISFIGCTASNVTVVGTNRLNPRTSPGRGNGFGWAPDIRVNYQYPAWNVTVDNCTATRCDVGFDTFNFQNSTWIDPVSQKNRTAFLRQRSRPGEPRGTKRIFYGSVWNQVYEATNYTKAVPVWNNAVGNWIERNGRRRPF